MKKRTPIFITFEGTEGAGKSTLIQILAYRLLKDGHDAVSTREPGGSALAERIRALILENPMDARTELFLYEAARAEHLAMTIRPALEAGRIVLCDRFADSSLAYQAHARGLPWKEVMQLNRAATGGLKPGLTVLIDIDPALGLARASDRNRFESEGLKFQQKVRLGFLKARREDPKRWLVLKPGKATPEELADQVMARIQKSFPQLRGKSHG